MPLFTSVVLLLLYKNQWLDKPSNKESFSNNYKIASLFLWKHYIYSSKTQIFTQGPNTCFLSSANLLAPTWIWTMTKVHGKLSLVNNEIPPSMNVCCFHMRKHPLVKILPPDSFMIVLHTCIGLVSALVNLMEHTMSFFLEFPIPWESRFIIFLQ
jgi:hypothetical protein